MLGQSLLRKPVNVMADRPLTPSEQADLHRKASDQLYAGRDDVPLDRRLAAMSFLDETHCRGHADGSEELAPALTKDEMEEWRWYTANDEQGNPVDLERTELAAEECARQPTIVDCVRALDGRQRARPPVQILAGRESNDYDSLLDTRVHLPNGKPVGF